MTDQPLSHAAQNQNQSQNAAWIDLLDWRRQIQALYADIRQTADPEAAWQHWRSGRDRLFGTHSQTPLLPEAQASFAGLPLWNYDPRFRFTAPIKTDVEPLKLLIPSSTGQDMPLVRFGQVTFELGTLDVYWIDVYGGGVFLPFRDATAGTDSYGGGRYLLDTVKGADLGSILSAKGGSELVLDFNFAYHPSCFYNPRWSCPLAPPSNRLSAPITAGERARP